MGASMMMPEGYGEDYNFNTFIKANENLMSKCNSNIAKSCLNLNNYSVKPIRAAVQNFFEVEADNKNKLNLSPDPKEVLLSSYNPNTNSTFTLKCYSSVNSETGAALGSCAGLIDGKEAYILKGYRSCIWEESLKSQDKYTNTYAFSSQNHSIQLLGLILKEHHKQIKLPNSQSNDNLLGGDALTNLELNPLNVTLAAVGTVAMAYCIYKIHSFVSKRWKSESQKETIPVQQKDARV